MRNPFDPFFVVSVEVLKHNKFFKQLGNFIIADTKGSVLFERIEYPAFIVLIDLLPDIIRNIETAIPSCHFAFAHKFIQGDDLSLDPDVVLSNLNGQILTMLYKLSSLIP